MNHSKPPNSAIIRSLPFEKSAKAEQAGADSSLYVVQYSRVALLAHDPLQLAVQPYNFEAQIEYLAENYHVISSEEMEYHLVHKRPFPERSIVLTFDGGYADLLYTVHEVLKRFELSATAFVPTASIIERKPHWYDELEDLLIANQSPGELEVVIDGELYFYPLRNQHERLIAYDWLSSLLSEASPPEQREILDQIVETLGYGDGECDSHNTLTAQEVRYLEEEGLFRVGATTHDHVSLNALTETEKAVQIRKNKEILEEITGHPITCFCPPRWSVASPADTDINLFRELGFDFVLSNCPGGVSVWTRSGRQQFPRIAVTDGHLFRFHKSLPSPAS